MATEKKFTLGDITSALSRLFNLLVQHSGLARLAGALQKTVNEMAQFQKTGLGGSGFQSLAFNAAPADLKVDAADAQKLLRERAHNTNPSSAEGIAMRAALELAGDKAPSKAGAGGIRESGSTGVQSSGTSSAAYREIAYASAHSLQGITEATYAGHPYAAAGMNYDTFHYLRSLDHTFTGRNIENAARDAKSLGFSANDKAAVKDHAIIDRYDPKARQTNEALKRYQQMTKDDEALTELLKKPIAGMSPADLAAHQVAIAKRREELSKQSGLHGQIENKANPEKSKEAAKNRQKAIDKKFEEHLKLGPHLNDQQLLKAHERTGAGAELKQHRDEQIATDRGRNKSSIEGDLLAAAGVKPSASKKAEVQSDGEGIKTVEAGAPASLETSAKGEKTETTKADAKRPEKLATVGPKKTAPVPT